MYYFRLALEETLKEKQPVLGEMLVLLLIAGLITGTFANFDIVAHFYYVGTWIAECPKEVQTKQCADERALLGLPTTAQIDIGNKYWNMLNTTVAMLGIIMALISLMFTKLARKPLSGIHIYKAVVYGLTSVSFLFMSWGDFLYFYFQKIPTPDSLPWLDRVGIFPFLLRYTYHSDVLKSDLFLAMALCVVFVFVIWIPIIATFKPSKSKTSAYY